MEPMLVIRGSENVHLPQGQCQLTQKVERTPLAAFLCPILAAWRKSEQCHKVPTIPGSWLKPAAKEKGGKIPAGKLLALRTSSMEASWGAGELALEMPYDNSECQSCVAAPASTLSPLPGSKAPAAYLESTFWNFLG
ncbi:hypothetical protein E5288_WYG022889 [Bos mutus]|uniref:Uncharacterized protein n=1 Tax=Bos mutus TaxID=72004 RepID=A0A6B0S290_9CETA|nr:hypothetical protein [Bos mutus]